jgi:site-specific recombinase
MNLTVSFSLAMFVATRACNIQAPERHAIYAAVARRAMRHPASFLFPTNVVTAIAAPLPDKLGT